MSILSKAAGCVSLVSCIKDMHYCGVVEANRRSAKKQADSFISSAVNATKTNYLSKKDSNWKNWIRDNNLFYGVSGTFGAIGGYIKGFLTSGQRYIPNFIASGIAIAAGKNHKTLANVSTVALALIHIKDFLFNSSGLFEKNDYLEH